MSICLVVSGVIESTPVPDDRMFDLAGATVTFPDLEANAKTLVVNRGNRPTSAPFGPANPSDIAEWVDVKWVPGTTYGQSTSDYPTSSLNPNWRDLVDGRVVLTHGEITATNPSDVAVKDSDFRVQVQQRYESSLQAGNDRPHLLQSRRARRIESSFISRRHQDQESRSSLRPLSPGRAVKLKLIGRHVHQTPPVLPFNAAVEHYCAFYQLLQPVPPAKDQLIPHLFS